VFLTIPEGKYKELQLTACKLKTICKQLDWWYYIWLKPCALKFFAIFLAVSSILLVWSESTFQLQQVRLSIPKLMIDGTNSSSTIEVINNFINRSLFQWHLFFTCVHVLLALYSRSNY
jgi:hypothetical protein